jgi:hypothetical protein
MARLRIRVELSRGGVGVPLHKLASVIAASQKFLNFLAEDVRIEQRGEWLAFDFDRESLNFTAEYVGAVTSVQVEAFNAAFDGTTSLRRDTISHFLQITEAIGEDEVIGFGLYQEDTADPTEWRCLSRRDALRIAEEVQLLTGAGEAPHLPAASDPGLGARMFGERRERSVQQNRLTEYVREVESGLSNRLQRVETQVQKHSGLIQELNTQSSATETSFRNLLSTFESFCNQATLNIEKMSPQALLPRALPAPASPRVTISPRSKLSGVAIAAVGVVLAAGVVIGISLWPSHEAAKADPRPSAASKPSTEPATVAAASVPAAVINRPAVSAADAHASKPDASQPHVAIPPTAAGSSMQIVLDATEPSWVAMKDLAGNDLFAQLIVPGSPRTVALPQGGVLRTGNAGGLSVRLNGVPIGSLGPTGKIREITFKRDGFTITAP